MSLPQHPQPAKLVIGLLLNDRALLLEVAAMMDRYFCGVDLMSAWLRFDYTKYYAKEMGTPLFRRMLAFRGLIEQKDLAHIKLATNDLEKYFASDGKRRVNIDPGYLLQERFVLATGKNFSHRIYIGNRIYADLTLIFQQGTYRPLQWTYPDYRDGKMIAFLEKVRRKYGADLRAHSDDVGCKLKKLKSGV